MKLKLFSYSNIPVYADITLLLLLGMLVTQVGFLNGIGMAAVLLLSILLHEFGHALVGQRHGYRIENITLMIMGGAAKFDYRVRNMGDHPYEEAAISVAGPGVSFLLALLCTAVVEIAPIDVVPTYLLGMIEFGATINTVLGFFNILPIFPMDGGRVARALLVSKHGKLQGTRYMMYATLVVGSIMLAFGLWNNMWMLVLIMAYVMHAGYSEYKFIRKVLVENANLRKYDKKS